MVEKSGNIDLAIRGILKLLAVAEKNERRGVQGLSLTWMRELLVNETTYSSFFGIVDQSGERIPNSYRCSPAYTEEALRMLLEHQAVEYCRSGKGAPLRINAKGKVLLEKLEEGLPFAEAIGHHDVTSILMEVTDDRFRAPLIGEKKVPGHRRNLNAENIKQGILRLFATASEKEDATGGISGEIEVKEILQYIEKRDLYTSDLLLNPEDVVAVCAGYHVIEPKPSDYKTFAELGGGFNHVFNPYYSTRKIRQEAYKQLVDEEYVKPGKDTNHVRLTEKGWEAVDALPPLTQESYDFRKLPPETLRTQTLNKIKLDLGKLLGPNDPRITKIMRMLEKGKPQERE